LPFACFIACFEEVNMKRRVPISLLLILLLPTTLAAAGRSEEQPAGDVPPATAGGSLGIDVVGGLHVTGTPIDVNLDEYRLEISGLVDRPLSLEFSDIRAMPAVHRSAVLICPGFFRDKGLWTGVPLRLLLERAGVRRNAGSVAFRSIDGSYEQTLPIKTATSDGVYLAYEFNGKIFDRRNGYPLRLVAEGEPGSVWVKWLGEIEVLAK
jgi:DMSO/TMAO reductase YedYZ molybdopterin-dependent catalytic subunit